MEVLAKKYFSLIIALGAVLGLLFPSLGSGFTFLVMPSLFVLMVFTVLKIDFSKVINSIKKSIPLIVALIISYIVLPAILYILSDMLNLNDKEKLSVMFSILAPTILSAPYFVSIMKGDVEFSFVLSVIITLLAPFVIPLELFFIFIWAIISVNAKEMLNFSELVMILVVIGIVQEFGFFIILRKISKLFMSDEMSKSFAFSIAIKNTALTAGVAILSSNELALASSIVVLLHVPMFSWIMHKREKI